MSWKSNYVQNSLMEKFFLTQKKEKSSPIKTWSRASTILPIFVGSRFRIYNGKAFFPLIISPDMVGHKFGEFVPTRARYEFKKKKKKK